MVFWEVELLPLATVSSTFANLISSGWELSWARGSKAHVCGACGRVRGRVDSSSDCGSAAQDEIKTKYCPVTKYSFSSLRFQHRTHQLPLAEASRKRSKRDQASHHSRKLKLSSLSWRPLEPGDLPKYSASRVFFASPSNWCAHTHRNHFTPSADASTTSYVSFPTGDASADSYSLTLFVGNEVSQLNLIWETASVLQVALFKGCPFPNFVAFDGRLSCFPWVGASFLMGNWETSVRSSQQLRLHWWWNVWMAWQQLRSPRHGRMVRSWIILALVNGAICTASMPGWWVVGGFRPIPTLATSCLPMKEQTQSAYWILASAVKSLPSRRICSMRLPSEPLLPSLRPTTKSATWNGWKVLASRFTPQNRRRLLRTCFSLGRRARCSRTPKLLTRSSHRCCSWSCIWAALKTKWWNCAKLLVLRMKPTLLQSWWPSATRLHPIDTQIWHPIAAIRLQLMGGQ